MVAALLPRGRRQRERLRALLEAAIERAIETLDALDGDPDLEPSLSSTNVGCGVSFSQLHWFRGCTDDREHECEDEGAQCDDEGVEERLMM